MCAHQATGGPRPGSSGGAEHRSVRLLTISVGLPSTSDQRGNVRLGHTYEVRPPPIIEPLPDPIPGYNPPPLPTWPDDDWNDSSIWDGASPEADITPPRPPPKPDAHDVPAPF